MTKREVRLEGGAPWGFRMNGGADSGHPLRISRVNPGSKAAQQGVREGDVISAINGTATRLLTNGDSHALLKSAGSSLTLGLNQDNTSSPKRRSRDLNKRENSAGSSQELNRLNDDHVIESQKSAVSASISTSSSDPATISPSQSKKQGKKPKPSRSHVEEEPKEKYAEKSESGDDDAQTEGKDENSDIQSVENGKKMSSSKARRLRKSRAKRKIITSDHLEISIIENCGSNDIDRPIDVENNNLVNDSSCDVAVRNENTITDDKCITLSSNGKRNADKKYASLPPIEALPKSDIATDNNSTNYYESNSSNLVNKCVNDETQTLPDKSETMKKKSTKKSKPCPLNLENVECSSSALKDNRVEIDSDSIENKIENSPDSGIYLVSTEPSRFETKENENSEVLTQNKTSNEEETNKFLMLNNESSHSVITSDTGLEITQTSHVLPLVSSIIKKKKKKKPKNSKSVILETSEQRSSDAPGATIQNVNEVVTDVDRRSNVEETSLSSSLSGCKVNKVDQSENYVSLKQEIASCMGTTVRCEDEILVKALSQNDNTSSKLNCTEGDRIFGSYENNDGDECLDNTTKMTVVEFSGDISDPNNSSSMNDSKFLHIESSTSSVFNEEVDTDCLKMLSLLRDEVRSPVELVLNPPTPTLANEETFFGPDWEIAEEMKSTDLITSKSAGKSNAYKELSIHDSPNSDLRAEVNSLIIVEDCSDDLGLTVDDIRTPIIPPDEEKKLRSFLETLDLVKPDIEDEDYYAHNEDAKEEIVVYRHCTRRSSAEACYIPPPHRHYLDVITEENSDLSDTDRKSDCDKPWENPQLIKKNNDIDEIPDDWGDSDQEVEYPSEEDGGIKPWNGGTTLEDAEGIEIVYLDSDNSDETVIIEDHSEKNEPKLVVCKTGEMSKRQKINSTSISNAGVFNTIKITSKENHDGKNNTDENAVSRVIVKEKELQIDKKTQIDLIKAIPKSSELVLSCNNKLNHSKINACENFFLNNENLNKVSVNNSTLPPVSNADSKISDDQSAYDFEKESVEIQSISQNTNPMECKSEGSRNFKNNLETLDLIKVCAKSDGEVRSDSENIYEFIEFRQEKDCGSIIKGGIKEIDEGDKNNDDLIIPRPQVTVDVTATPILSRQNSSSSGTMTTQSTSKYNQSPTAWSSENEENPIVKDVSNMSFVEKNPESLRELSTKKVISLPNGLKLLEDIGIIQFRSVGYFPGANKDQSDFFNFQNNISGMPLTEFDFPDIACPPSRPMSVSGSCYPNRHSFSAKSCSILYTPPRSLVNSPPCSLPPDRERWIGIPTASQNTFVCFSPSQSSYARKSTLPPRPQEAAGLLDLHKKFIERRGYHEDRWRDSLSDLQSPDLIRLEQYNAPTKQRDYTPELLAEAANLLALKEYRESRCKESKSPDVEECEEDSVLKRFKIAKSKDFIKMGGGESSTFPSYNLRYGSEKCFNKDVETLNDLLKELEIDRRFGDDGNKATNCFVTASRQDTNENAEWSKGVVRNKIAKLENASIGFDEKGMSLGEVDTEQSDGSRLLALIQSQKDRPAKLQPIEAPSCNSRACSEDDDRSSGGVMTRGDRDSSRVFDADDYKISKRGDIAVMAGDGRERIKRPERPKSLPPGSSGSGTELFRQKMYEEYMEQVAERYERRQQKVIRLSRPASLLVDDTKDSASNEALNLEDEFMVKVRERMSKLGINLNEDQNDDNNNNEKDEDVDGCLPKHLQEFAQLAQVSSADPDGVWSPAQTPEAQRKAFDFSSAEKEQREDEERDKSSGSPPPVVWSPKSVPSPTAERKSYRPVKFESPPPIRKNIQRSKEDSPKPPTSLPLTTPDWSKQTTKSSTTYQSETTDVQQRLTSSQSADSSLAFSSEINLPRAPNPTITLLQKAREGQLPRGAHYLEGEEETASIASDDRRPHIVPNEIIYTVKKEYCSEGEDKKPKKIVELGPRKFEGIGPTTKEGIPIVLRSEVKDTNQQKWYKRMYDSLHKAEADKYVTVRYRSNKKDQYPYASAGGYLSEPDRLGYDSDLTSSKYATLDRRRIRNKEKDFTTSTMPRSKYVPDNSVKKPVDVYKNQPGRIEDYEPGRSSISEKEAKQWWDEVLDIFDEQFEQAQNTSRPPATTPNTGKPFMTYALKESGYESDSTLVFKRRDENLQNQLAMSPAEQKMAYKAIQKGGEVPLHGLRKPAPERPKEPIIGGAVPVPERSHLSKRQSESPHRYVESEVTIHYKSPVRAEAKEALSEEELAQRQAETMRRIYQEERRRKYLQELQDMYSRRHTDNFIPSQKSPIPLNRYDDFPNDVGSTLKSRDRTPEPKLVARALYNFVGQSSRELTFRRGDIIYVRRQIDKNWFEGEHNAMIGLFPLNHVEIIPYDGIRTMPKRSSEGQARAKFNFQAQTHLELSLVKGELVVLTRRVDENWFEGRIGSRKGIFPVSYVEVLVEPGERAVSPVRPTTPASNKPVASPASHSMILNGARNALSHHHYTPPPPVSYTSLSRPTKTSKQDLAPVNQALHIDTQSEPVPYRALYNYKPQNDDELELNEGDVVYVMEKCDDGWYVGSSQRTACFGTFPGNYVQRLPRGAGLSAYEDSILQQKDSHRVCY